MNNVTKVLISYFSRNPDLVNTSHSIKEAVNRLIIDHSNHLLLLALAAASIEQVDWNAIEETFESIKLKD